MAMLTKPQASMAGRGGLASLGRTIGVKITQVATY
jgi:hypothetical protein